MISGIKRVEDSITRPADTGAYDINNLVSDTTVGANVRVLRFVHGDGGATLERLSLYKSTTTTFKASFSLHLYEELPVCSNGDNGDLVSTFADFICTIDMPVMEAFSDVAATHVNLFETGKGRLAVAKPSLYILISTRERYIPSDSEVFTLGCTFNKGL